MCLRPAPAATGIVFKRIDVPRPRQKIPARYELVADSRLGTTLMNDSGVEVATVEHLMAALAGCGIDNVLIELDGPEVPAMDGSAAPFVFLIDCAGIAELSVPRVALRILKEVRVEEGEKFVFFSPGEGFSAQLEIEFPSAAIKYQKFYFDFSPAAFKAEISRARTFGFLTDVENLRNSGRALGGSFDNAVVIDGDVILNKGGLRYADEFVRHKMLDAIGDLYLAGAPIIGRFTGSRSGHSLNNALLRTLFATPDAWTYEPVLNVERDTIGRAVESTAIGKGISAKLA